MVLDTVASPIRAETMPKPSTISSPSQAGARSPRRCSWSTGPRWSRFLPRPPMSGSRRCANWSPRRGETACSESRRREARRGPEHPAEGNSPGELAHPRAGEGAAGRSRSGHTEGQARLRDPGAAGRLRASPTGAGLARCRDDSAAGGPLGARGSRREGKAGANGRVPVWVKQGINSWMSAAGIEDGRLLRSISRGGKLATA